MGALSFGPLADLFGRKWFMILAVIASSRARLANMKIQGYLTGAHGIVARVQQA